MNTQRVTRIGEYVILAVLVAGTAWLGKLVYHNRTEHGKTSANEVRRAPRLIPAKGGGGEAADLRTDGRTRPLLLLVLRTECPFCEQNMPGWGELLADLAVLGDGGPEPVVLSVSPPEETAAYLARHDLEVGVRYVEPGVLPLLGLVGFPSTVAIDPGQGSLSVWDGVLTETDRRTVLAWAGVVPAAVTAGGGGG